eukprot:SM000043S15846  [mRNA]  locus=s43:484802:492593:+ [translate_table: standard]
MAVGKAAAAAAAAAASKSSRQPGVGPEPLRRAIAECTQHHLPTSVLASEGLRILIEYLSNPGTVDVAYNLILEHAMAERDRSPPVTVRCVALLKKYLFRYVPPVTALQQIDSFCVRLIADTQEAKAVSVKETLVRGANPAATSAAGSSAGLVKSLAYVRALVARHLPKLYAQAQAADVKLPRPESPPRPRAKGPASSLKRASLAEWDFAKASALAMAGSSETKPNDNKYILTDILKGRWRFDWAPSPVVTVSGHLACPQPRAQHTLADTGAAAVLVQNNKLGRLQVGVPCTHGDFLHSSDVITLSNSEMVSTHLRTIAANKRLKGPALAKGEGDGFATIRRRVRPPFQYRHYSEQQPLRLSETEMEEVILAVCSASPGVPGGPHLTGHAKLAAEAADVAASVLIKLFIDMYLSDPEVAAPMTLSVLESMLASHASPIRSRAFDLILNLAVHAHLLEPLQAEDHPGGEIDGRTKSSEWLSHDHPHDSTAPLGLPAYKAFEAWLLNIANEMLLYLVQIEESEEVVWASALSSFLYLVADRGQIIAARLARLDVRVLGILLEMSREHGWAEELHTRLVQMLSNVLYCDPLGALHSDNDDRGIDANGKAVLDLARLEQLGGIEFISTEYDLAPSSEARRNLFAVLVDYVLLGFSKAARLAGKTIPQEYISGVCSVLAQADSADSMVLAFKCGLLNCSPAGTLGEQIADCIVTAMSRDVETGRFNTELLRDVMGALDELAAAHSRVPAAFAPALELTLATDATGASGDGSEAAAAWHTLGLLLHSTRAADRAIGRHWVLELLSQDLSRSAGASVGSGLSQAARLLRQLSLVESVSKEEKGSPGGSDKEAAKADEVLLSVRMLCALLQDKRPLVRREFVLLTERILLQYNAAQSQHKISESLSEGLEEGYKVMAEHGDPDRAIGLLMLMCNCLWQVVSANDTDRVLILQMCNLMFTQLCLPTLAPIDSSLHSRAAAEPQLPASHRPAAASSLGPSEGVMAASSPSLMPTLAATISSALSLSLLLVQGLALSPRKLVAQMPTALLYWPLMQLAPSPSDDTALATAVGSRGGAGVGAAGDARAALLLLLIGKTLKSEPAIEEVGGDDFFRSLLDDPDAKIAYLSSAFLLKRMMRENAEEHQRALHRLVFKAQQSNNEKLLVNPYLQIHGLLQATPEPQQPGTVAA